ncbi:sigma-70 family RNA polymerase sigma factor [Rubripirellula amarantea]|nr:sigma-70 family RNA polymerase sigma factor [Rubripirellula amarantea]
METAEELKTRSSLIRGLQSNDQQAWQEFHNLYYPLLIGWARRYGLGHADADELVGELFESLTKYFGQFRYDDTGSFRAYMRTILKNLNTRSVAKQRRFGLVFSFDNDADQPRGMAAASILDAICDAESQTLAIMARRETLSQVPEIDCLVWTAMTTDAGTIEQLEKEFEMSRATLYRKKNKVAEKILKRFKELSGDED